MKMVSKKFLVVVLLMLGMQVSVKAQWPWGGGGGSSHYFSKQELPRLMEILPAPPEETSEEYAHDVMRYLWGKNQRLDADRAATARRQATWTLETMYNEFSEPFGMTISQSNTPELIKLLKKALETTDQICDEPKSSYNRRRPFDRLNEPLLTDGAEESASSLKKNGSYPSGHTNRSWVCALILAEINPDNAVAIFKCGLEYGESRVIVGAHWQSDVEAGRIAGSIAYSRLQTSTEFREQIEKAKEEFRQKMSATGNSPVAIDPQSSQSSAYTLGGTVATSNTHGIVIQNNQKVIR